MFERLLDEIGATGFLEWWNDNPITFGGDKYSDQPGIAIHYIPHSNQRTFEIKVEPVQLDRPHFTQAFLCQLLKADDNHHIDVSVRSGAAWLQL